MHTYTPVIGLETHVELATKSKMFCDCPADWFGKKENTLVCPVCLGLPGALPVPNKQAIMWTVLLGLALHCTINTKSKFDRKNYFYPDLPKGYQISQYDEPFAINGHVDIGFKKIRIRRVHLEEDTGKLLHISGQNTRIDFNRSGVPLVEIVTEPDIRNSEEAVLYLKQLQTVVRTLKISSADMEKGSMRLEPNISLFAGEAKEIMENNLPGYKVEVKNINSFRFAKRAIDYELIRHERMLREGTVPAQETRGWNEAKNVTVSQRLKEEASDYRYFPDPDIPPVELSQTEIDELERSLPLLPEKIYDTLKDYYKIRKNYVQVVAGDPVLSAYVFDVLKEAEKESLDYDAVVGMIVNKKVDYEKLTPKECIEEIKTKTAKGTDDETVVLQWADEAISQLPDAVADFKKGKVQAVGVLIGKVMQLSKGKAQAQKTKEILLKKLNQQ